MTFGDSRALNPKVWNNWNFLLTNSDYYKSYPNSRYKNSIAVDLQKRQIFSFYFLSEKLRQTKKRLAARRIGTHPAFASFHHETSVRFDTEN